MLMSAKTSEDIQFQLVNITIEQFALITDNYNPKIQSGGISVAIKFGIDVQKKRVINHIKIQLDQEKKVFLILETSNHYQINPDNWFEIKKTEKQFIIPKDLATHLAMISTGTIRGILFEKTKNTPEITPVVFPLINIQSLVTKNVELNLND